MAQSSDLMFQIEQELMENIAKRLEMKGNTELPNYTTIWQQRKLSQLNDLQEDNLKTIRKLIRPTLTAVDTDVIESGLNAVQAIEPDFKTAIDKGVSLNSVLPYQMDPELKEIVDSFSDIGQTQAKLIVNNINSSAQSVYLDSINKTVQKVNLGISTPNQALRQTIREWSKAGLPAFVDSAGRTWTAESYYNTVLRSTIRNVTTDVQFKRMDQYGTDLIEVSSHLGSRPLCEPYQGNVYSRNGTDNVFPDFTTTSFGDPAGLLGVNCKHQIYPFFRGVSTTSFDRPKTSRNDKNYKNSQTQRKYERDIRAAKREKAIYKANNDKEGVRQSNDLIKKRNARMETFLNDTGRTRRSNRELIYAVDDTRYKSLKQTTATSKSKAAAKKVKTTPEPRPAKKWVILKDDKLVTSFDTKKDAVAYGSGQRKKGEQVFLWKKEEFNSFRSQGNKIP